MHKVFHAIASLALGWRNRQRTSVKAVLLADTHCVQMLQCQHLMYDFAGSMFTLLQSLATRCPDSCLG